MPNIRKIGSTAFYVLVALLVTGILVENVILMHQNRKLKSPDLTDQVRAGDRLQNLSAANLDGKIQPIVLPRTTSERLVIFTFSPGCPFCQKTQPIWAELAKHLQQRGVNVLWVSRDPVNATRGYCTRIQIPVSNVVAEPPNGTFKQLGLQAVPNTIVVGSGGLVEKVWAGALDSDTSQTVFAYFGIPNVGARMTGLAADVKRTASAACCDVPAKQDSP